MDYAKTLGTTGTGAAVVATSSNNYWLIAAGTLVLVIGIAFLINKFWSAR